ncbi:MAG TPA: D-2-hydroxyacid dehydrogenase [Gammaproteobacteria bacterium]
MKGVFLDYATVSRADIDPAPLRGVLGELVLHDVTLPAGVAERIGDAAVILTNKCRIGAAEMDAAPALELIVLAATGFNNIDTDAAKARNIAVTNVRAYCTPAVVQHVFALMLALNQKLDGYRKLLADSAWKEAPQFTLLDFPFHELNGQTLGIIGHGELGSAVARVAVAFGLRVLMAERKGCAPREGRTSFETVLRDADIISLHCPLTPETERLIDAGALAAMKRSAILINTARGAIVDEAALAQALRNGEIGGAGIDVLSEEPPVNGNPLLDPGIPNLIVTPHIAWAAVESRQRAVQQMADCIAAFHRGGKLNRVV